MLLRSSGGLFDYLSIKNKKINIKKIIHINFKSFLSEIFSSLFHIIVERLTKCDI